MPDSPWAMTSGKAPAVVLVPGEPAMTNSVGRKSAASGIRIQASNPVLTGNSLLNNAAAAMSMDLASNPTIGGVTLVGNGIGRSMHEEPQIPNFGEPGRGPKLAPGMTLAIEPMITAGRPEVFVEDDRWSVSTNDGSLAAHFEHTVAVTESGPRILTRAPVESLLR